MKSNLVLKFIFFLIFYINFSNSYSEELKFEAQSIVIIDKDKIIIAKEGVKILSGDEIVIDLFESMGAEFSYDVGKDFSTMKVRFINNKENIHNVTTLLNFIFAENEIRNKPVHTIKIPKKPYILMDVVRNIMLIIAIKSDEPPLAMG